MIEIKPPLRVAHLDCINMPSSLDGDGFDKWINRKVVRQEQENRELREAVKRLEETLLPLREDPVPELRDEPNHIDQTNGE